MRGKRFLLRLHIIHNRNIPAYAGKTPPTPTKWTQSPGTSPRMRGKPYNDPTWEIPHRNIPAYAGKTRPGFTVRNRGQEHPRVCGENPWNTRQNSESAGTSPRMRGKPNNEACPSVFLRNIPAYAGKTAHLLLRRKSWQEHPRVCGENMWSSTPAPPFPGTSPRMRGKHLHVCKVLVVSRNIPAYAGKTLYAS